MRPAISVTGLSKRYRIGSRQSGGYRTLRETVMDAAAAPWRGLGRSLRRGPGGGREPAKSIWALKDLGFEVRPGEAVGIIGHNGAGKSTLLKVLSRITEPTAGRVEIRGRLGSLLEVGTGFHPELTGRENVFLNGAILGMSRQEIARKFDEIVAFAEIEEFIDTPVKRYSSGMYVRLGFAVAAHMALDLLLIDEVLSVGDYRFQRKCLEYAKGLRDRSATVLIVSHNMFSIKSMCSRALYLSQGQVQYDGPPDQAIALYEKDSRLATARWAVDQVGTDPTRCPIYATEIQLLGEDGQPRSVFEHGERMRVRVHYEAVDEVTEPTFTLALTRSDNVTCCNYNTELDGFAVGPVRGRGVVELLTPPLKLVAEVYTPQVLIRDGRTHRLYSAQTGGAFHVRHEILDTHYGVYHEPAEWSRG
jgi:lipopolysaccharide transport system ATP-binding protein